MVFFSKKNLKQHKESRRSSKMATTRFVGLRYGELIKKKRKKLLADRMTNTLIIDRFNINEIHVMFNSHRFSISWLMLRVWGSSRSQLFSPCSLSIVLAYISLIRSFFCYEIYQTLKSQLYVHSRHTRPSEYTNIMYIHSTIFNYLW